jgi:hypothetical protein
MLKASLDKLSRTKTSPGSQACKPPCSSLSPRSGFAQPSLGLLGRIAWASQVYFRPVKVATRGSRTCSGWIWYQTISPVGLAPLLSLLSTHRIGEGKRSRICALFFVIVEYESFLGPSGTARCIGESSVLKHAKIRSVRQSEHAEGSTEPPVNFPVMLGYCLVLFFLWPRFCPYWATWDRAWRLQVSSDTSELSSWVSPTDEVHTSCDRHLLLGRHIPEV